VFYITLLYIRKHQELLQVFIILSVVVTEPMKSHQLIGMNWLIQLHDNRMNGLLADEMVWLM
jgi:SNF2 family DNA or RNA helicase